MRWELPHSPRGLFALSASIGMLSAAGFAGMPLVRHSRPLLVTTGLLTLLAILAGLRVQTKLKNGIQNERWSVEAVDPLRRLVLHPCWRLATVACFGFMIASLIVSHKGSWGAAYWSAFLLTQTMSQLSGAVRLPVQKTSISATPASGFAPLHSDHWGEGRS